MSMSGNGPTPQSLSRPIEGEPANQELLAPQKGDQS